MGRIIEESLEQFHRTAIAQTRSAGLCAYVLAEDGSVTRFRPDGTQELIVLGRPRECLITNGFVDNLATGFAPAIRR